MAVIADAAENSGAALHLEEKGVFPAQVQRNGHILAYISLLTSLHWFEYQYNGMGLHSSEKRSHQPSVERLIIGHQRLIYIF